MLTTTKVMEELTKLAKENRLLSFPKGGVLDFIFLDEASDVIDNIAKQIESLKEQIEINRLYSSIDVADFLDKAKALLE